MSEFVMILPEDEDKWKVRVRETSIVYDDKADAEIAARALAIFIGGEVQPRNRRGRIQDPSSFGNDPRESRG